MTGICAQRTAGVDVNRSFRIAAWTLPSREFAIGLRRLESRSFLRHPSHGAARQTFNDKRDRA
jgi:hypothetical protein